MRGCSRAEKCTARSSILRAIVRPGLRFLCYGVPQIKRVFCRIFRERIWEKKTANFKECYSFVLYNSFKWLYKSSIKTFDNKIDMYPFLREEHYMEAVFGTKTIIIVAVILQIINPYWSTSKLALAVSPSKKQNQPNPTHKCTPQKTTQADTPSSSPTT